MNQASLRASYEMSKAVLGLVPVTGTGVGTGPSIDRTSYLSATVDVPFAASGAPTNTAIAIQLQDAADGATFTNFGAPTTVSGAAVSGVAALGIDLSGARQFIRAVVTPTLTGGTSPSITLAAVLRLRGPDRLPAL